MRPFTIRARIVLLSVGLVLLVVLLFAGLVYALVRSALHAGVDADLRARAAALAVLVEDENGFWVVELDRSGRPSPDLIAGLTGWEVRSFPDGELLLASQGGEPPLQTVVDPTLLARPAAGDTAPRELGAFFRTREGAAPERHLAAVFTVRVDPFDPAVDPAGAGLSPVRERPARVVVRLSHSLEPVRKTLARLFRAAAPAGAFVLLLAVVGGLAIARGIVRPVERLARAAEQVRPGEAGALPRSETGDEVDRLAAGLELAFRRLSEAYERQGRFAGDASHELRTPLSVIRSQTDVALRRERSSQEYRAALESIRGQAERMSDTVEGLMLMARLGTPGAMPRWQPVSLSDAAKDCVGRLAPSARRLGVAVGVTASTDAVCSGDPRLVDIALRNLLENAIRHAGRPGRVQVRVERAGQEAVVEVSDDGEGLPPDRLEQVFEPFCHASGPRHGERGAIGLGLSIVAAIAQYHGGRVSAASDPGRGATFTLGIPLHPGGS